MTQPTIDKKRFREYAKSILADEECFNELRFRLGMKFFLEYRDASKKTGYTEEIRKNAAAKTDVLDEFMEVLSAEVFDDELDKLQDPQK